MAVRAISALVIDGPTAVTVGGLTLTERAVLLAHRVGLIPVRVWGLRGLGSESLARLRSRGVSPVELPSQSAPFGALPADEPVVIIGPNVLLDSRALTALAGEAAHDVGGLPHVAREAGVPLLVFVPARAATTVRRCTSIEEIVARLATAEGPLREADLTGHFLRRVDDAALAPGAERDYVRYLNGGESESFFTKIIRRFSVPLSSRLVRLGARPTQVTLGGLGLAVASAACLAYGSYGAGLLGAGLYYTSMIFDCSDGEVARLTVRDSAGGAWLETVVDYATYFLVLGALTLAVGGRPGADRYRVAALMGLAGSVIVAAVASYLRHLVAAADPGQFDESSAKALASATPFHRFARWGRQWIKRSTVAHLLVVLALVNQLPVLLYLWAFGATVAAAVILIVEPFVAHRVQVPAVTVRNRNASE
jgi:phosphatidylglycerophosphate synthase